VKRLVRHRQSRHIRRVDGLQNFLLRREDSPSRVVIRRSFDPRLPDDASATYQKMPGKDIEIPRRELIEDGLRLGDVAEVVAVVKEFVDCHGHHGLRRLAGRIDQGRITDVLEIGRRVQGPWKTVGEMHTPLGIPCDGHARRPEAKVATCGLDPILNDSKRLDASRREFCTRAAQLGELPPAERSPDRAQDREEYRCTTIIA
jgi:hypothetical protein